MDVMRDTSRAIAANERRSHAEMQTHEPDRTERARAACGLHSNECVSASGIQNVNMVGLIVSALIHLTTITATLAHGFHIPPPRLKARIDTDWNAPGGQFHCVPKAATGVPPWTGSSAVLPDCSPVIVI